MATLSTDAVKGGFDKSGDYLRRHYKYTGPASYATGGDSLPPEQCRLGFIANVLGLTLSDGTSIWIGWWDATNKKIKWYVPNTGNEVAAATNLSTAVGYLEVIGK